MFLISAFFTLVGFTDVYAATLVEGPIENTYYTRRGGGKPYMSAQYHTYTMDGKTVYCIEPGVDITIHDYTGNAGWINSPYSEETNRKIQLYGYYGYDYPGHHTLRYRMAAQSLIWEETGGQIIEFWTEPSGWGEFINLNYERNEIKRLASQHYNSPSFKNETKDAIIGETVSFTDSNGILSQFEVFKSDNATSVINGNTLSVTPNKVGDITVMLKKKTYTSDTTTIFVGKDNKSQKMGFFGVDDPVYVAVKLKVSGASLEINKKDIDTNSNVARGDSSLKGAVYELLDENRNFVAELVTDEFGRAKTEKILSPNKIYILKEKKSSQGFLVDPKEYRITIDNNDLDVVMDVYEKIIERDVEIFKVYASGETGILTPEPNVTFDIYLKSSGEYYKSVTTNSKGYASIKLPYGTWIWKQKTSTENYEKVDDFEVIIDKNSSEAITKIISNAEVTAKLKLVKVDKDSNKVLVRDGIKFKIKNLDTGEYVCQNITYPTQSKICVFETTKGMFVTPYVLGSGNYQIEELEDQKIEGYVWNSEPLKFTISENSEFTYDDEFGVILEVKFANKQVKGEVEINKIGEEMIIEDGNFKYEEIKLDGVTYDLYADGNIYSADGTLIYKDKELIKTFKTVKGYYKLTDMYLGGYCLVERESVLNHVVDSKPYCFKLEYKDQYTDIVSLSFTFKNYVSKGDFELTKTDFSTGKPVGGALIEIFTEDDQLIFSGRTDEVTGKIVVKGLETGKKYKFIEKEAPEGFILNTDTHFFEIKENGEIVKDTLSNEKITSKVIIHKVDEEGNPVAGVKIKIYDTSDNLIGEYITDEFGNIEVVLEYNDYYYQESETVDGLVLNPEKYYFSVTGEETELEFTLVNEFEEIEVPNTSSNSYLIFVPILMLGAGAILLIINDKRKK